MKNILIIMADQLSAQALSCYGGMYAHTPNLDRLAGGVKFDRAYTPFPLCQPARTSIWSSSYPHQNGVEDNLDRQSFSSFPEEFVTLGDVFSSAGYDCNHFGKEHDQGSLRGFNLNSELLDVPLEYEGYNYEKGVYMDAATTKNTVKYIDEFNGENPFLLVSDFNEPHSICCWIGDNEGVHEDMPSPFELPQLPDNFEIENMRCRPRAVQYLCCLHRRLRMTTEWSDENFRHYLAAYHYYIGILDKNIGKILNALDEKNLTKDTLIVFYADHGEGMANHRMVTKHTSFYDSTNRVPLFFYNEDMPTEKTVGGVASLMDIAPTLAEFAGFAIPDIWEGISQLSAIYEGESNREYSFSQWHGEWLGASWPGRMVTDGVYKLTMYVDDPNMELYDLVSDPGERKNLYSDKKYEVQVKRLKKALDKEIERTGDVFYSLKPSLFNCLLRHNMGYNLHEGLAGGEIYGIKANSKGYGDLGPIKGMKP